VTNGLSEDVLCAAAGFRASDVADRDRHVPRAWYLALRLAVIERLPDVNVGIEVGKFLSAAQIGYLDLAVQHCETPREGLALILRYVNVVLGGVTDAGPRIEDNGELVHWVVPLATDDPPEATESHFIHIVLKFRSLVGDAFSPRRVRFVHQRDALRSELEPIFRCPIEFGGVDSRITFESRDVDRPITTANAEGVGTWKRSSTNASTSKRKHF
jgi:hypothetical protein